MNRLLLASSSSYRAKLLAQLGFRFDVYSPDVNEQPSEKESPHELAYRLSKAKAQKAQLQYPDHTIIASDQVACLAGSHIPIGKPYTAENAIKQLTSFSGNTVHFFTGLCVIVPKCIAEHAAAKDANITDTKVFSSKLAHKNEKTIVERFDVHFRELSHAQIAKYVELDSPLNCAGSFKAEGLGIHLFAGFDGRDYNSLIGLPLMALIDILHEFGIDSLPN